MTILQFSNSIAINVFHFTTSKISCFCCNLDFYVSINKVHYNNADTKHILVSGGALCFKLLKCD